LSSYQYWNKQNTTAFFDPLSLQIMMKKSLFFRTTDLETLASELKLTLISDVNTKSEPLVEYAKLNLGCALLRFSTQQKFEIDLSFQKNTSSDNTVLIHLFVGNLPSQYSIDQQFFVGQTNAINLIDSTQDYSFDCNSDFVGQWILLAISTDWLDSMGIDVLTIQRPLGFSTMMHYCLQQLQEHLYQDQIRRNLSQMMLFNNLLYQLLLDISNYPALPYDDAMLQALERFLLSNLHGQLPLLDDFAMLHEISITTLKNKFQQKNGTSVRQFFYDAQMELALQLLSQDHNVKAISIALGYANPSNFTNAFKRKYGFSPSKYSTKA
jgi:AraC-like DNA-binding protein